MNKKTFVAAFLLSFTLVGCSLFNKNKIKDANDFEKSAEIDYCQTENILGEQAYDTSFETDYYRAYYWYLGTMYNVPIRSSTAYMCQEQSFDATFTFSEMTSKSMSQTMSHALEYGLTTQSSFDVSVSVGAEIGVHIATESKVTAGVSVGVGYSVASSRKSTYTTSTNEEYVEQHSTSESLTIRISKDNGCKPGRSYRVIDLNNIDVYGLIVYNKTTGSYEVQSSAFVYDNTYVLRAIDESDDKGRFNESNWNPKEPLEFDAVSALNYAMNHPCENVVRSPEGSYTNPYPIRTVDELKEYMNDVNKNCENSYMALKNDLDLSSGFNNYSYPYFDALYGNIVGNGFSIKNAALDKMAKDKSFKRMEVSIFGTISETGSVSGIVFENNNLTYLPNKNRCVQYFYGALVTCVNRGVISNCTFNHNTISVDFDSADDSFVNSTVGMAAARNYGEISDIKMLNCNLFVDSDTENGWSSGSKSAHTNLGGLVAYNAGVLRYISIQSTSVTGRSCNMEGTTNNCVVGGMTAIQLHTPEYQACIVANDVTVSATRKIYNNPVLGIGYKGTEYLGTTGKLYAFITETEPSFQ